MNTVACFLSEEQTVPRGDIIPFAARREFGKLEEWMFEERTLGLALHEIEQGQVQRMKEIMRLMLQAHIDARGKGDVGKALEVVEEEKEKEEIHTHKRVHTRHQQTIFGEVTINRAGYGGRGKISIHPKDESLQLPERSFSYELQKGLVKASVQGPFDEAIDRIEENTGVIVPKRSVEDIVKEVSCDFDSFYEGRIPFSNEKTGSILVGAVDCKGIPMKKEEKTMPKVRQKKGEKANKKKMATVATVFTQEPYHRTPEEVTESLFEPKLKMAEKEKEKKNRNKPEHKRVWASLTKGKEKTISEVAEEIERRDQDKKKIRVVITDGERALQKQIKNQIKDITQILDLFHVLEKLWGAAYVFHQEGTKEAKEWIKKQALRILSGNVSQVIKGIRQSATKRRIRGNNRKTVDEVTGYFYRNRLYMKYNKYLEQGLPIASGSVEGACKNLVKDRMERSGMRWTKDMAEAMLKMRAIYLSGDFEDYWSFHIKKDQERVHPKGRWRPILAVVQK
ncbi:MAG: ISKra4 family transposase [Candidatus Desantisbacteria bacterium]